VQWSRGDEATPGPRSSSMTRILRVAPFSSRTRSRSTADRRSLVRYYISERDKRAAPRMDGLTRSCAVACGMSLGKTSA
jgi:hypothetical protein